mmetsp:Transcript_105891/g.341594  ORF Transcript_105891/g.341594 Transcript_105891/m.341594 type:complete len:289 (-) Transcript_105891:217-1083(-)
MKRRNGRNVRRRSVSGWQPRQHTDVSRSWRQNAGVRCSFSLRRSAAGRPLRQHRSAGRRMRSAAGAMTSCGGNARRRKSGGAALRSAGGGRRRRCAGPRRRGWCGRRRSRSAGPRRRSTGAGSGKGWMTHARLWPELMRAMSRSAWPRRRRSRVRRSRLGSSATTSAGSCSWRRSANVELRQQLGSARRTTPSVAWMRGLGPRGRGSSSSGSSSSRPKNQTWAIRRSTRHHRGFHHRAWRQSLLRRRNGSARLKRRWQSSSEYASVKLRRPRERPEKSRRPSSAASST